MIDTKVKEKLENAINKGASEAIIETLKNLIKPDDGETLKLSLMKETLQYLGSNLKGLTIEGYQGDFPTFIEPVCLTSGVEIGDTVLLGPNVIIDKKCQLGDFCELSYTILFKGVNLGKYCKLNWCIVDDNTNLPQNFEAKDAYISKNDKGEIEILNF